MCFREAVRGDFPYLHHCEDCFVKQCVTDFLHPFVSDVQVFGSVKP